MNALPLAVLNGWEVVVILAVVLVLFGAKKLPELARGLGQGIKEFKKATRDVQEELHHVIEDEPTYTPPRKPAETTVARSADTPAPDPDLPATQSESASNRTAG